MAISDTSFRRHSIWALFGRVTNVVVVAMSAFVFVRLMPKADFGHFMFLQTLISLAGVLAGAGTGTVAIRQIAADQATGKSGSRPLQSIWRVLLLTSSITGAVCALSWLVYQAVELGEAPKEVAWIAVALGAAICARSTHQFFAGSARASGKLATANLLDGANGGPIMNGTLLGTLLFLAAVNVSITWQVAIAALSLSTVTVAAIGYRTSLLPPSTPTLTNEAAPPGKLQILTIGIPIALSSLVFSFSEQIDLIYAGVVLGDVPLADYCAAKRISLLLRMPFAISNMALAGIVSHLYASNQIERLKRTLSNSAAMSLAISLVVAVPLLIAPVAILRIGFGQEYIGAAFTMQILILSQLAMVTAGSCQQLLILTKHHTSALYVNILSATVAGIALLCWGQDAIGIAFCYCLATAIRSIAMWWIALKQLGINTAVNKQSWNHLTRLTSAWSN